MFCLVISTFKCHFASKVLLSYRLKNLHSENECNSLKYLIPGQTILCCSRLFQLILNFTMVQNEMNCIFFSGAEEDQSSLMKKQNIKISLMLHPGGKNGPQRETVP